MIRPGQTEVEMKVLRVELGRKLTKYSKFTLV